MANNLYQEAVDALMKYHRENPSVVDCYGRYQGERRWVEPSEALSRITWKYVYLNNTNGLIAKYDIGNHIIVE